MKGIPSGVSILALTILGACLNSNNNSKAKIVPVKDSVSSSNNYTIHDSTGSLISCYEMLKKQEFKIKSSKVLVSPQKKQYLSYSLDSVGNSLLKVININTNGEDSSEDKIDFYFSKDRESFLSCSRLRNETVNTIFTNSRQVISYNSSEDGITVRQLSRISAESKISVYMFILATHVLYFDKYYTNFIKPSLNSLPAIKLNCPLELKSAPNREAKTTGTLENGSRLFYLGCAGLDTLKGIDGIWYRVQDEQKKHSGWIFGDINCVELLTDDNW